MILGDLPESDQYRVIVNGYQSNSTGEYIVRLALAPEEFVVPTNDEGGPMTIGFNHPGNIPDGDLDQWTFTAEQSSFVQISMTATSGNLSPTIRLISPNGDVIGYARLGGDSGQIVVNSLPESGTYRVIVGGYQANGSGEYLLTYIR